MKFGIDVPPELRNDPHFVRGHALVTPALASMVRGKYTPAQLEQLLTGALYALAPPLVGFLGRERAHAAVDTLKRAVDAVYEVDKKP